jgi:hypothetical protein
VKENSDRIDSGRLKEQLDELWTARERTEGRLLRDSSAGQKGLHVPLVNIISSFMNAHVIDPDQVFQTIATRYNDCGIICGCHSISATGKRLTIQIPDQCHGPLIMK